MRWGQPIEYASLSDVGFRRQTNQDSLAVQICESAEDWENRGHLFVVADGIGGHAAGELASKIATDHLPHTFFKLPKLDRAAALKEAIESTNTVVHDRGQSDRSFDQMGTTCSAMVISPEGLLIGHVGDSRVYRIREGRLDQLTFDHSLHWELLRRGQLTEEESENYQHKNVILRSLGPEPAVEVDLEGPIAVMPKDHYLLCSDGLTAHVKDEEIGMVMTSLPLRDAIPHLVHLANLRGGTDNITVVGAKVLPGEPNRPPSLIEPDEESEEPTDWPRLLLTWGFALGVMLGFVIAVFGHVNAGLSISFASAAGGFYLFYWWWRYRRPHSEPPLTGRVGEPYRSASATLTTEFVDHNVELAEELLRIARTDGWDLSAGPLRMAIEQFEESVRLGGISKVFPAAVRVIHALMGPLRDHIRRSRDAARARS